MLTIGEIKDIRAKMKREGIFSATLARRIGVSRQAVNVVLNQNGVSKRVEEYLLGWVYGEQGLDRK